MLHWRQMRSYLLAEECCALPADPNAEVCDLCVRGYLRGGPLTVYDYVHLTGEGSHEIKYVKVLPDPSALKERHGPAAECECVVPEPTRAVPLAEFAEVEEGAVQAPQWTVPNVEVGVA